jgi:hypothetical protein
VTAILERARTALAKEHARRSQAEASIERLPPVPSRAEADAFAHLVRSRSTLANTASTRHSADMAQVKVRLAAERARIARAAEPRHLPPPGTLWRATPTRAECNTTAATGRPVMQKLWDLSPIDQWSFDPTQPPSALPDPPVNTSLPQLVADSLEVGAQLIGGNGAWTGGPTYARQWNRDGAAIAGAVTPGYVLVDDDLGAMINHTVTASNAGGSSSASSDPVGPIVEAAPLARAKPTSRAKAPR